MGDQFFDVFEFAIGEELDGSGIGIGVAETSLDVDFASSCCRDWQSDVGCTHADKHDSTTRHGALLN